MGDIQRENAAVGHSLSLLDRAHAEISGVVEVHSFDEESVVLDTAGGELTLEGTGLRVGVLDLARGVVVVDGNVSALYYTSTGTARKKSRLAGLFRSV